MYNNIQFQTTTYITAEFNFIIYLFVQKKIILTAKCRMRESMNIYRSKKIN